MSVECECVCHHLVYFLGGFVGGVLLYLIMYWVYDIIFGQDNEQ